jgi:quinol monooxygenase YgiN
MIVVRVKIRCQPEKTEQLLSISRELIAPSRAVEGVISFDIGQDISDPDSFITTEVFEDLDAMSRQESLPVVQKALGGLAEYLAAEPEATVFHVSSSEPYGARA